VPEVEAGQDLTVDGIPNAAVENKRWANTVAARRGSQRKLEDVKRLEKELKEVTKATRLCKERVIAAENISKQYKSA
jgi:hypothetical protein